ncbi:hypothetical protein BDM02DRAFT_3121983 [Thelephora ganbajun]|uniref:Uncharacterized protein n=1 Tax=Thelephora ganbajun TaxID=370292 RepID=A0ACB6Z5F5_THEGA|nr:hypothetical protein BDM02DRAFT_3121983 [Thelephora ganbajun]
MRVNVGCVAALFTLHFLVVGATESREFDFHVSNLQRNGVQRTVVNGQYPGPLIRVPYGSHVRVNLFNDLDINHTSIHWHGIHQHGTPYSDGFPTQNQCPIPPKKSMKYNFNADPPGTALWHAHFHSMNADGLYGPFVVEDRPGSFPFLYDEERVILLTDEYGTTSWELEDYVSTPDANGNPHLDPTPIGGLLCLYDESDETSVTSSCSRGPSGDGFNLNFEPGKVYRLRIICGSIIAPFIFSIDQHELQLVSSDFSPLDGNTWVKGVPIATGQRYDVLVRTKATVQPGAAFWIRATLQPQCWPPTGATFNPDVRGVLTYNHNPSKTIPIPKSNTWNVTNPTCDDISYSLLRPHPSSFFQPDAPSTEEPSVSLFLNYTFPIADGPALHTLVNGQRYQVDDTAYPTLFAIQENAVWTPPTSEQRNLMIIPDEYRGKTVRIVLIATGLGSHPFHMHGHGFQVVAIGVGSFDDAALTQANSMDLHNAVVRDTVTIPAGGWVVIHVTADNPGVWALHCHIGWHLKSGMLGQIVELPQAISNEVHIPQTLKNLCGN